MILIPYLPLSLSPSQLPPWLSLPFNSVTTYWHTLLEPPVSKVKILLRFLIEQRLSQLRQMFLLHSGTLRKVFPIIYQEEQKIYQEKFNNCQPQTSKLLLTFCVHFLPMANVLPQSISLSFHQHSCPMIWFFCAWLSAFQTISINLYNCYRPQ